MTATCLPMTGNFYDTVVVASLVKQWWYLSFIQSISVRKVLETTKNTYFAEGCTLAMR